MLSQQSVYSLLALTSSVVTYFINIDYRREEMHIKEDYNCFQNIRVIRILFLTDLVIIMTPIYHIIQYSEVVQWLRRPTFVN